MIERNNTAIPVVIVAGMGKDNLAIGKENGLLWHVPEDMKRFKTLTLGHPVIMGRKTFESIVSILGKPLPGRTNIVVTRDHTFTYPDVQITHSLDEAFEVAASERPKEIHIGGGEELYRQSLPFVDRLHLTFFYDDKTGDTHFPNFEADFTTVNEHPPKEHEGLHYQWVDYVRNRS